MEFSRRVYPKNVLLFKRFVILLLLWQEGRCGCVLLTGSVPGLGVRTGREM